MDKIKILVVDDHAILREGIRSLLSAYTEVQFRRIYILCSYINSLVIANKSLFKILRNE